MARELERQRDVTQTMLSHRKMSSYHAREKVVGKLSDRLDEIRRAGGAAEQAFEFQLSCQT